MHIIETTAKNAGLPLGTIIDGNNEYLAKIYERGYQFVAVCADMQILISGVKSQFNTVKSEFLK